MKILFVCGGGVIYGKETVTVSLMEGLRARGHDILCLTSTWGDRLSGRLDKLQIPYRRLPLGFISKTLRWEPLYMTGAQLVKIPELWRGYRRFVKEFDPDFILHTNVHHLLLLWPFLDSRRTLFWVHDYFLSKFFYRVLFKFLNLRLRAFVGVSNFIRNSVIQLKVPPRKVFSVLNGIDIGEVKRNGHYSSPIVTLGIVGQIAPWKGHGDLIEALKILKDRNLPFHCVIFGEGEQGYIEALNEKIGAYGLKRQIHWVGYVEQRQRIFAGIDICVIPSRSNDPCPTVAMEAQHFGIPVVATRRGGLPELVLDGETGYLLEPGSLEQLTQKLRQLIEQPNLRSPMGQNAKYHASRHFTQDRMIKDMELLLLKWKNILWQ